MAAPAILRQRKRAATARAYLAAKAIAQEYPGIETEFQSLTEARGRDHEHTETARLEALADFLQALQFEIVGVDSLKETEEILKDENAMRAIRASETSGDRIPFNKLKEYLPSEDANGDADGGDPGELEDIDGIGPDLADNLRDAGYQSPQDLREASDEDLSAIDGVGPATLKKIRAGL